MKKILVPTDFSDNALKAALYAAEIAKRNHAAICLLHATGYGSEKEYEEASRYEVTVHPVREDNQKKIEEFRKTILSAYKGISVKTEIAEGDTVHAILEYCEKNEIEFIIMGTTGADKLRQRLVGTTTAAIVTFSKLPVLVVPEKYKIEKPDRILFATNHFERSKTQLNMIMVMAQLFSTTVHVVVFTDTDKEKIPDYIENNRKLDQYRRYLTNTYPQINFVCEAIQGSDFENAIELYHVRHETDIVALITYPKGFWEKVLHPGVTRKMVYHSHIPVLAIPYITDNR